jgi:hypothetical protein
VNTTHFVKRAIAGIALAAFALRGLGLTRFGASGYRPGPAHLVPRRREAERGAVDGVAEGLISDHRRRAGSGTQQIGACVR